MARWEGRDLSLNTLISRTNMEEIVTHYDAQKPDEFGCKICDHILLNMEKMMRTNEFCVQSKRLQSDGDTPLHAIPEFTKLKEVIPIADPNFSKDQWGISNLSKPDGVWLIEICNAEGQCRARVPLFVEVDSGNEGKFKKQPRVMAMKMWQHVAVGHWVQKVSVVTTLRIETQLVSRVLAQKANEGRDSLTPEKLIVQHLRDLTGACAEILHGITMSCLLAQFGKGLAPERFYETAFFKHLQPSMQGKERRDFHFFVGPFGLKLFDIGSERILSPALQENELDNEQETRNLYKDFSNKTELIPSVTEANFNNAASPARYFKQKKFPPNSQNAVPNFLSFTGKRDGADEKARYIDGFWTKQAKWSCEMGCQQMDFDKHSSILSRGTFMHSRVPMHCVSVQRTDLSALVVPPLQSVTVNQTTTIQGTLCDMPNGMFYIDDIFTVLDIFIKRAQADALKKKCGDLTNYPSPTMLEQDEGALQKMLEASFDLKSAFVRIPSSYSYTDLVLSRPVDQAYKQFFYSWSGFHLFVEPFIAAMENTLYRVTHSTVAVTDGFQSYADAMTSFKRSIARGEVQFDMRRERVEFPKEEDPKKKGKYKPQGFNLASRCLFSYTEDVKLDPELEHYLYSKQGHHRTGKKAQTLDNEYLVLVCKWFKCTDKPSLSALVRHYMNNESIRKSIDDKLKGFSEGIRSEILYMFEVVFTDPQFLVKKTDEKKVAIHLAFRDSDLESGLVHLYVRVHWLPYEVIVNFDRLAWKSENVYDMTTKQWQNIDINMQQKDVDNKDLIKSQNLVMLHFGGPVTNIQQFLPPRSHGASLWSARPGNENRVQYDTTAGGGWIFAKNWQDRTRLLRALSLTNLQMTAWDNIENFDDINKECEGTAVQEGHDDIQNNLEKVRQWLIERYQVNVKSNWVFFTRPNRVPPNYHTTAIEENSLKYDKIETFDDTNTKNNDATKIQYAMNTSKIDLNVRANYRKTDLSYKDDPIENYFEWIEVTHDYLFFTYDNCHLKTRPKRTINPTNKKRKSEKRDVHKLGAENERQSKFYYFEHDPETREIPALNRKDIILHEALGTYFGVGYQSQQKRAKMQYYLHERFPILTRRYLPYKLWRQGILSEEFGDVNTGTPEEKEKKQNRVKCAWRFIQDVVRAVEAYQKTFFHARHRVEVIERPFTNNDFKVAKRSKQNKKNDPAFKMRVQMAHFLFDNTQVFARHLHIVWSWKWFAVKASCINSYKDWFVHKPFYKTDAEKRANKTNADFESLQDQELENKINQIYRNNDQNFSDENLQKIGTDLTQNLNQPQQAQYQADYIQKMKNVYNSKIKFDNMHALMTKYAKEESQNIAEIEKKALEMEKVLYEAQKLVPEMRHFVQEATNLLEFLSSQRQRLATGVLQHAENAKQKIKQAITRLKEYEQRLPISLISADDLVNIKKDIKTTLQNLYHYSEQAETKYQLIQASASDVTEENQNDIETTAKNASEIVAQTIAKIQDLLDAGIV